MPKVGDQVPVRWRKNDVSDNTARSGHHAQGLSRRYGGLGFNGIWGDRAAQGAIEKINEAGGIAGRKAAYVVEDTETNVQAGIRKMRKLIERDEVDFTVGDVHSGINIACAPIAEEENTVYFGLAPRWPRRRRKAIATSFAA